MYDGSIYQIHKKREKKREKELYKSHIIIGLTNTGIVIHRREDFVASSLDMIIWTYAAKHWR